MPVAEGAFEAMHFAAKKGAPVSVASLAIVQLERWLSSRNESISILFLDIKSAYYSIVRQLALGDFTADTADCKVCALFRHFQIPPHSWNELILAIRQGGVVGCPGTSEYLCSLIKDSHDESFFVARFATGQQVCVTQAGRRPGESLADLIYAWVYHAVLQDIMGTLLQSEVLLQIPHTGEKTPFPG